MEAIDTSEFRSALEAELARVTRELAMTKLQLEAQVPVLMEAAHENLHRALRAEKALAEMKMEFVDE